PFGPGATMPPLAGQNHSDVLAASVGIIHAAGFSVDLPQTKCRSSGGLGEHACAAMELLTIADPSAWRPPITGPIHVSPKSQSVRLPGSGTVVAPSAPVQPSRRVNAASQAWSGIARSSVASVAQSGPQAGASRRSPPSISVMGP